MAKASNRTVPAALERPGSSSRPPTRAGRPSAPKSTGRRVVRTPVVLPGENQPAPRRDSGQPRRFLTTLCFMLIVIGMLLLGRYVGAEGTGRPVATRAHSTPVARAARPAPRPSVSAAARSEAGTSGQFAYVGGFGPVLGRGGPIHRFKVAIEKPAAPTAGPDFADEVNRTLGDKRSWIASGRFRLQRVSGSAYAEFTIYLAAPGTSERMCATGGLETGGYTSCRLPQKVIINDARWDGAVHDYNAPVSTYRQYAINHEVGHQLGHRHEACPGKGRPAPVMMQQTFGLKGCVANAWPYRNGKRYTGPPVR
jgi:Protein of unknown function (DUF3152)